MRVRCARRDGARGRERHCLARGAAKYSAQRRGCRRQPPARLQPPPCFRRAARLTATRVVPAFARAVEEPSEEEDGSESDDSEEEVRPACSAAAAGRACTRPARHAVLTRARPFPRFQAGDDDKEEAAEEEEAEEEEEVRRSAPGCDEPPAAARAHPQPRRSWPPLPPARRPRCA